MSESLMNAINGGTMHNADVSERLALEELNKIDADTQNTTETVERFGFANLNATSRASDVGVAATDEARHTSEEYGYRGVIATKDAEKDVLGAICSSSSGLSEAAREILLQVAGGTKDVLMHAAQNTTSILLQSSNNTKELMLQACGDTDSIKSQAADQFKDVLLQSAGNASAVALQNTLNAKDSAILAVSNAKDAALRAAVDYERLSAQGDRNTAALQASIAECCCEQRELVRETSCRTDALIREMDEKRVKDELMEARFKILALENKIPTVSVAA